MGETTRTEQEGETCLVTRNGDRVHPSKKEDSPEMKSVSRTGINIRSRVRQEVV